MQIRRFFSAEGDVPVGARRPWPEAFIEAGWRCRGRVPALAVPRRRGARSERVVGDCRLGVVVDTTAAATEVTYAVALTATTALANGVDTITLAAPSGTVFTINDFYLTDLTTTQSGYLTPLSGVGGDTVVLRTQIAVNAGNQVRIDAKGVTKPCGGCQDHVDLDVVGYHSGVCGLHDHRRAHLGHRRVRGAVVDDCRCDAGRLHDRVHGVGNGCARGRLRNDHLGGAVGDGVHDQ